MILSYDTSVGDSNGVYITLLRDDFYSNLPVQRLGNLYIKVDNEEPINFIESANDIFPGFPALGIEILLEGVGQIEIYGDLSNNIDLDNPDHYLILHFDATNLSGIITGVDDFGEIPGVDGVRFRMQYELQSVPNKLSTYFKTTSLMFFDCYINDPNITNWDLSNIKQTSKMFYYCYNFNQPINNWNVSNVEYMEGMFSGARDFNQPLNNRDVSNVKYMHDMFFFTNSFNQDIGNWNTINVEDMDQMFRNAYSFNQNLTCWPVEQVLYFNRFNSGGIISLNNLPKWGQANTDTTGRTGASCTL